VHHPVASWRDVTAVRELRQRPEAHIPATRRRVLLISPLPPPAGGVASWTTRLLESPVLAARFEFAVLNTNPGADTGATARKALGYATLPLRLLRRLRDFRPDLVHLNSASRMPHLVYEDLALVRTVRRAGSSCVLHFHGSTVAGMLQQPLARRVVRDVIHRADAVFALNRGEVEALRSEGTDAQQVSNFVGARPFRVRGAADAPLRLLYVGWVIREKGVFELLEALRDVPDTTLTVVGRFTQLGGGSSEAVVRSRVAELGLADRVTFAGEVPLTEMYAYYDDADVFLLPSWTEGFPTVLLEAMISSLPAICTPVGAIPEVLRDEVTGLLVPVRNPAALAAAIRRMRDAGERARMGRAGWERATSVYERETVLGTIGDRWESIIDRRTGAAVRGDSLGSAR
jgi:glycosyltransferase involved in cell wall biosynthesis